MNSRILLVVGDKFSSYAKGKDAITISQLRSLLTLPEQLIPTTGRIKLIPGQGLGDECIQELLTLASDLGRHEIYDFSLWQKIPQRAPKQLSHKHHPENTLISTPTHISEDIYELYLLIDENGELMQDHQSGQHVQGMLLIEAVRQATVAITEMYYLQSATQQYAFVLNNMSVKYNNFSFPVPAKILCRITNKVVEMPKRLSFTIEADVIQCDTCVSNLTFEIAAMNKERIYKQESRQAINMQKRHMISFEDQTSSPSTAVLTGAKS
ncbi:AfsA-related hotdog domain-containing protein [Gilvimarinus chinensis]|uniref:AfsA-related hotdog domain-containing protein n=1 Tax=Gilvimarinus chinensis TaxID=396005 RepID=UPI00035F1037|nr:AfsA-related hotdog domain-containing protein [Gilvimarinus chinensis]